MSGQLIGNVKNQTISREVGTSRTDTLRDDERT